MKVLSLYALVRRFIREKYEAKKFIGKSIPPRTESSEYVPEEPAARPKPVIQGNQLQSAQAPRAAAVEHRAAAPAPDLLGMYV